MLLSKIFSASTSNAIFWTKKHTSTIQPHKETVGRRDEREGGARIANATQIFVANTEYSDCQFELEYWENWHFDQLVSTKSDWS